MGIVNKLRMLILFKSQKKQKPLENGRKLL